MGQLSVKSYGRWYLLLLLTASRSASGAWGSGADVHIRLGLRNPPKPLELELAPENSRLKLSSLPKVCPDKSFKFRVTGHRHPLEPATAPRWPSDRRDDPRTPARKPAQGLYT